MPYVKLLYMPDRNPTVRSAIKTITARGLGLRWDTPLKGLSLQGKIGANYYNAYSKSYRAETYFDENKTVGPTNLDVSDTDRTYSSIEALAQYTNSFARHSLWPPQTQCIGRILF